jgi:pimeloyl-ACP methyl ester carboxylesterase
MGTEGARAAASARVVTREIDVTEAAGLGVAAHARITIVLPPENDMPARPVVAFAVPGAGYNRSYFTLDLFENEPLGQAGWHAERGWILVAVDTVGVGEASLHQTELLTPKVMAGVGHAIVEQTLALLAEGGLAAGLPPIAQPVVIGIGQSMGGGLTILQQAHHHTFDAIAILGFSAVGTQPRPFPGSAPVPLPYISRDTRPSGDDPLAHESRSAVAVNREVVRLQAAAHYPNQAVHHPAWHYHFDDVEEDIIARDRSVTSPPLWRSATVPGAVFWLIGPGALAPEAAAIVVPVLSVFGERDVCENPRAEHGAFRYAVDFSSFICPRMGHMHNFASTRALVWSRLHHWAAHVVDLKSRLPEGWPLGLFSDGH